jgi:isopentenyldiphosphate isomerase
MNYQVCASDSTTSLAGDYLLTCYYNEKQNQSGMDLVALQSNRASDRHIGAHAWDVLHQESESNVAPECRLSCRQVDSRLILSVSTDTGESTTDTTVSQALLDVLSKVLVQWHLTRVASQDYDIVWLNNDRNEGDSIPYTTNNESNLLHDPDKLASHLFPDSGSVEFVEMVDRHGHALGRLPRPYIHQFNLLHRGVGLFVARPGFLQDPYASSLYCHQRTSTKRIFPSLFDMFVGGVSSAGEDAQVTASREVAEELGLSQGSLEYILQCVVCTSYNRCVVDLFVYTSMDESVKWQPEEVAWGDWVDYATVERAADKSIQRLVDRSEWPGRSVQSKKEDKALDGEVHESDSWDFVPDGLLVWEAWLDHLLQQEAGVQ